MPRVASTPSAGQLCLVRIPPFIGYETHHPHDVTLPFALAWIATIARARGWSVQLIDAWASGERMSDVVTRLRSVSPDVVVFEAHAAPYQAVLHCARAVRDCTRCLIAFGTVPTFTPQQVVGPELPFDVAIQSEAELTVAALLERIGSGAAYDDVAGIALWHEASRQVVRRPARDLLLDLDALPPLDYRCLDLSRYYKYSFPVPLHRTVRWGHVLTTRGCPYPCTHCSIDHRQSFGRRLRRHSAERIGAELQHLSEQYAINAVSIEDDIFTLDHRHVHAVCDEIERRGLDLKWVAQTRVDCIDRPLVQRMKRAGCVGLSLGIESGNDRILVVLKKGFTRNQALEGIRICQEEGLMLRLLFMVGNPSETLQDAQDTIDLALRARAITIQVHIATPYPGTTLSVESDLGNGLHDFSSYNRIVSNMSRIPDPELWALQSHFYRTYYFSPRYAWLFTRQRLRYIAGSWRRDLPLVIHAARYLAWESCRPATRDVEASFATASAPLEVPRS
jgi:anaerobic magnesium-protoporphyrin IX monomethyl ester cyclase